VLAVIQEQGEGLPAPLAIRPVGLAVIVSEGSFVIAEQRRPAIVGAELPTMAEVLAELNVDRLVCTNCVHKAIRLAIWYDITSRRWVVDANIR
jgi:hypothetical protein